jgi:hypothetical protein
VLGGREVVDNQNIAFADPIEFMDDVAANETRAASNDNHKFVSSLSGPC